MKVITREDIEEHIACNVFIRADGCWEWLGQLSRGGYAIRQYVGHASKRVHRTTYELTWGEIPEGLVIDHLCRNRACVNPWHLEAVTNRENLLRGLRPPVTLLSHCAHGHELTPENIKISRKNGVEYRECWPCNRAYRRRRWARIYPEIPGKTRRPRPPALLQRVDELHATGLTLTQIAQAVGLKHRQAVHRILNRKAA